MGIGDVNSPIVGDQAGAEDLPLTVRLARPSKLLCGSKT